MNYFEFYTIQPAFFIDEELLKKLFYQHSKDFHPDFHALKSEDEQQKMLELSTYNNKAYFVLKSLNTRLEYLLKLNKVLTDDEKYSLPPEFLMEMMDINEEIMELEFEPNPDKLIALKNQASINENDLLDQISSLAKQYDAANDSSILLTIKDLWYRKKYLLRIKDSLNKFAT